MGDVAHEGRIRRIVVYPPKDEGQGSCSVFMSAVEDLVRTLDDPVVCVASPQVVAGVVEIIRRRYTIVTDREHMVEIASVTLRYREIEFVARKAA